MGIPRQNYARIKTYTFLYADACERSYDEYLKLDEKITAIGKVEYHPELQELEWCCEIAGIQTIIFAAMCLESAIYEYAADHLGDTYVQDHLDKLDTISKWVVSLRLVAGYELRRDRASYAALKELIVARNRLVHTKSEPLDHENIHAQLARLQQEDKRHSLTVTNAYKALVLMSTELEAALGPTNHPLPSYDPKIAPMLRTPVKLQPVVAKCRQIILGAA